MDTSRNPADSALDRPIAISTDIERATVHRRLPVHGYQPIDVTERAGADPGTVTYRFTGHRASGTAVIIPQFTNATELLPTRVAIHLGAGGSRIREHHRSDLPTINGVTLSGSFWLDPHGYLTNDRPRLSFRRASGGLAPRATNQYATAIITALLAAWLERPQRHGELQTLARCSAAARLATLQPDIRSAHHQLGEAMVRVQTVESAAAALATLAHEDDGTGAPDGERTWFKAWSYAAAHAPTSDNRGVLDTGAFATWYAAGNGADNLSQALGEFLTKAPAAAWLPAIPGGR